MSESESESESELLYDWRFTANQFVLATNPLRPTARIFIFQLNICGYSPYVTSCLRRRWVYRLQLLSLASTLFSGPSPTGIMYIFYCLWFETPQTWRSRFPSPRHRVTRLYPQALGSFFIASCDDPCLNLSLSLSWVLCYDRRSVGQSLLK
jgi:hypothetical protein